MYKLNKDYIMETVDNSTILLNIITQDIVLLDDISTVFLKEVTTQPPEIIIESILKIFNVDSEAEKKTIEQDIEYFINDFIMKGVLNKYE